MAEAELTKRVAELLQLHLDLFPSQYAVSQLPGLPGRTTLIEKIGPEQWLSWQIAWVRNTSEEHFKKELLAGKFHMNSPEVAREVNSRVIQIIERELEKNPNEFPDRAMVAELTGLSTKVLRRVEQDRMDRWQLAYLERTADIDDLLKSGTTSRCSSAVQIVLNKRLEDNVAAWIAANPVTFPTPRFVGMDRKMPDDSTLRERIPPERWEEWQIQWVKTSPQFLSELKGSRMNRCSPKVDEAIDRRIRDIFIERLIGLGPKDAVSICDMKTLKQRIPDLEGFLGVVQRITQKTPDQTIVEKIGLNFSEREPWVNRLIERRMEQLWFFRELLALAKTGNAEGATIVSFTHPELSQRLAAVIPEVQTSHVLMEELEAQPRPLGNRVILLSVLGWLTPARIAGLLSKLADCVSENAEIFFTYPSTHYLNPTAFEQSGFRLEKEGRLELHAVDANVMAAEKLDQETRIGILKRTGRCEKQEVHLFVRAIRDKEIPEGRTQKGATYERQDLRNAVASVITYQPQTVAEAGTLPRITAVDLDSSQGAGILSLSDGAVVGFNTHPRKPGTIEIEGKGVTQPFLNAVAEVTKGGRTLFDIDPGLEEKYAAFVRTTKISGEMSLRKLKR